MTAKASGRISFNVFSFSMPQKTYLNEYEKIYIDKLKNEGMNTFNIAKKIDRHPTTVNKYLKSRTEYGTKIKSSGRPRKIRKRLKRNILKLGREGNNSVRDIEHIMIGSYSSCSASTLKHSSNPHTIGWMTMLYPGSQHSLLRCSRSSLDE